MATVFDEPFVVWMAKNVEVMANNIIVDGKKFRRRTILFFIFAIVIIFE